jgi:hypothetical protein
MVVLARVSSGAGLRDCHSTNHALILVALNFVFALISILRDRKRAPPATLVLAPSYFITALYNTKNLSCYFLTRGA